MSRAATFAFFSLNHYLIRLEPVNKFHDASSYECNSRSSCCSWKCNNTIYRLFGIPYRTKLFNCKTITKTFTRHETINRKISESSHSKYLPIIKKPFGKQRRLRQCRAQSQMFVQSDVKTAFPKRWQLTIYLCLLTLPCEVLKRNEDWETLIFLILDDENFYLNLIRKIRSHELNRLALPASLLSPRRSSAIMHKSSRSLTSAGLARDSGKAQWKREAMKEECTRSEKFVRWERQKWSINLEMDELDDARGTWLYAFESSHSRYWNFLRVFLTKFGDSLRRLILMSLQSQLKLDVKLEKCQSKSRVSWPSATSSSSSSVALVVTSETRFSPSSLESC